MKELSQLAAGALLAVVALVGCQPRAEQPAASAAPTPAPILLFDGTGTSPNDVVAVRALLDREKLRYVTADSAALDRLTTQQLGQFDLLIIPGGNFEEMGKALKPATTAAIRAAVQGGVNYLGICAGAFIAGDSPYNGINLTGKRFGFHAESETGVRKTAVRLENGDGTRFKTYWEDGPELSGWGTVLAQYQDDTPAVVQGKVGAGWVVLTGVHLEAPQNWYDGLDAPDAAVTSTAYALELIHAALNGEALPYL